MANNKGHRIDKATVDKVLDEVDNIDKSGKTKVQIAKENNIAVSSIKYWQDKRNGKKPTKKSTKKAAKRAVPRKGAVSKADDNVDQLDNLTETVRRIRLMNGQARDFLDNWLLDN